MVKRINRWKVDTLDKLSVGDILFHGPINEFVVEIQENAITTIAVVKPDDFRFREYRLRGENEIPVSRRHDK